MKKLLILLFSILFLNAQDIQIDASKAISDGMKQGINGLANEMGKNIGFGKEKREKTNKFPNLKINGVWEIKMDKVYTNFLQYSGNLWEIDLKKNGEVYAYGNNRNYKWKYKNDIITFNSKAGIFSFKDEIKILKDAGNRCFDIELNNNKAKMCKLKDGLAKDLNEAVKIEIK